MGQQDMMSLRTASVIVFVAYATIVGDTSAVVAGPAASGSIAMTPDGREIWCVNRDHDSVSVLEILDDAPYLRKLVEIDVGVRPRCVAVSPDSGCVLVTCQFSSSVAVIRIRQ